MADSLSGLFDSDPGFLEELAAGSDGSQSSSQQQPGIGSMITSGQGQMPGSIPMMQPGHQQSTFIPTSMQQTSGITYQANMQYPKLQQQQQQYSQQPQQQKFNQYSNQQMYNHSMNPSQAGAHMNPMMGVNHRGQFGNQPRMMPPQGQSVYMYETNGAVQQGPRLPNPAQQPRGIGQMPGWNQGGQMYPMQQQQQQQQYLPRNEFSSIPNAVNQPVSHMQKQFSSTQHQPSADGFVPQMSSPGPVPRMPMMNTSQQQQMYSSGITSGQTYPMATVAQGNIGPEAMGVQQKAQYMQQHQQQDPNTQMQFQQQFPYRSPPQQQTPVMPDGMMNSQQTPNMPGFPQTSPTHVSMQQKMGFNNQPKPPQNVGMMSPPLRQPAPSPTTPQGMLSPGSTGQPVSMNQVDISPTQQRSLSQHSDLGQPLSQPQQQNRLTSPTQAPPTNIPGNQQQALGSPVKLPQQHQTPGQQQQRLAPQQQQMAYQQQQQQQMIGKQQMPGQQQQVPAQQQQLTNNQPQQMSNQQIQQQRLGQPQLAGQQQQHLSGQQQQMIQHQQMPVVQKQLSPQQQLVKQQQLMTVPPTQQQPVMSPGPNQNQQIDPAKQTQPAGDKPGQTMQKIIIIKQPQQGVQGSMGQIAPQPVASMPGPVPGPTLTAIPQPVMNGSTGPAQQGNQGPQTVILRPTGQVPSQPGQVPTVVPATMSSDPNSQQDKANKIIAEAIAKAQMMGNTSLPKVIEPPELPTSLGELDATDATPEDGKKKKKKRKYTPKKEKGEKGEKAEKTPKEKKKKKEKTPKKEKKVEVKVEESMEDTETSFTNMPESVVTTDADNDDSKLEIDEPATEGKVKKSKKKKKEPSEKIPKSEKKRPKKPPATFLKNKKRKRRNSSPTGSDVELKYTPPPSPENDEFKRRSGRNVKRKKYMDDVDLNLSDEDTDAAIDKSLGGDGAVARPVENTAEEDSIVVDKILGSRMRKPDADEEGADQEEVEEFFIKYKNFSYLHCEWRTEAEIRDKRIQGKIKRYKQKKMNINDIFDEDEELFNPDYVEVDRVLEESKTVDPTTQEEMTHYLVKWRSLPYEDSTWELQQDVDPEKVKIFKRFSALPDEEMREWKSRPKASAWEELKEVRDYKNGNQLRAYQLEGVNWLTFNWHKRQNCILADEMGLGKTIQSITFLQEIANRGINGPFLVVAPLSTIANWQREFETWTNINTITYHGTSPSRYMLQEYEMYYRDDEGNKITDFFKFHALVTTYEIILSDLELLQSINWRCLIIDEAHRLKNKNCSLIKCMRSIDVEHKVLLSGTPLQNNVEELFSLLNFLEPSQFTSSDAFLVEFGNLQTEEQVDKLKAILKPMMLRRLKEDVEKNLARKEETIIEVELTNIQKKYYRAILEKNFSFLCKGANSTNVPSLLNTMMELRKCCNHPYLLNGAEENILTDIRAKEGREPEHIKALINASGKFVLLDKLLPKLKQNGHRVLIFSQMIRVLDIIEDYLIHKKYLYERLDGRIRGNLRQEAIDRYSKTDSDRFVFLICTKAGGLGINLTAADTVIIYDSDWNPQNDLQAQARCHRIGQSKMVKVYRLITRNSYEREMFNRASMKLGLDKAVLQSMGGEKLNPQQQLTKREIEDLLRKGAYGALMEDDSAADKFCEEDIESILARRTQVIEIESEGKGSTFSKASFSAAENRDDIDINDPEFWQKWAKKADVDVDTLETRELIVDEPRVRKRTARYGNNDNVDLGSELESDSDTDDDKKGKKTRRGRRGGDEDDDFEKERHRAKSTGTGYGRSELFKVEKGLLHYGWGRWKDILSHARFKRPMEEKDVENVAKAILLYGLQYYKGDERIKEFISDLIAQEKEGGLKNHSGLSAPVPRGRKGKKAKDNESHFDANEEIEKAGIKMDRDITLNKNAYKRHIHRHSNKVLLRVRTLYYLKHEVLGDVVDQIDQGVNIKDITLPAPVADNEPPVYWWDELADKSLLVGTYKHGYEKYNLMRSDPSLAFLERCGPPDGAALAAEMKDDDDNEGDDLDETGIKDDDDEDSLACASDATSTPKRTPVSTPAPRAEGEEPGDDGDKMPFPTPSELNTRLRRIITTYQRDFKKQMIKQQQQAKRMEKREKLDAMFKERETRRRETNMKWTRREETDFYRVVSTYGIEFDRHKGRYIWDKFRVMARLDKKTDEQLTEYFISFYHMCLRVCRKIKEEAYPPTPVYIEPITEERANRCIARIDLLSKIREEIVVHPKMESRMKQCQKSYDLPNWWINGKHDRELLIGAAKHGLARTDYYIMNDKNLSFKSTIEEFMKAHSNSPDIFKVFGKDTPDSKSVKVKAEKKESEVEPKTESTEDAEKAEVKPDTDTKSPEKADNEKHDETETKHLSETSSPEKDSDKTRSEVKDKEESAGEKMDIDKDENPQKDKEAKEDEIEPKDKDADKDKKDETEKDSEIENGSENAVKAESKNLNGETKDVKSEPEEEKQVKMETDNDEAVKGEAMDGSDTEIEDNGEMGSEVDDKDKVKTEVKEEVKEEAKSEVKTQIKAEAKQEPVEKIDPDEEVRQTFEGDDSQMELLANVSQTLLAQWPKDRIVFHRLEQICYCVETGDWPFPSKMKHVHILGIDSNSNTPTRSLTPSLTPKPEDEIKDGADKTAASATAVATAGKKDQRGFDVQMAEGEGLKMTFHKRAERGGGGAGGKRSVDPQEAEKTARIQAILAQSIAASQASSDDSQQESVLSSASGQAGSESPFLNGSHAGMTEEELMMNRHLMMEQGLMFPRSGRRGRKRKEEKMAEIAMAEALARRQTARGLAILDPGRSPFSVSDARVPVVSLEDGSRLSGEDAPLKKNLEQWLDQHPGYMIDTRAEEIEEGEIVPGEFGSGRKGRRPKIDPSFMEVEKLTGEENVSVINRMTGKRITGAKAPPLRYLAEWLEQNPTWDVDPKWAELVKQKGSLPKQLSSRVVTPSRRGRRPRDSPLSQSMLGGADPHQAAALAASMEALTAANLMAGGFGKLPMPFGSMPGLGMNPMLGLAGFPGFPGLAGLPEEISSKQKDLLKKLKEEGDLKLKDDEKNAALHPSFPLLFNPLMYNPALLAAHGLGNFPIPTSLAGLDASLLNGHASASPKEESNSRSSSKSSHRSREHREPKEHREPREKSLDKHSAPEDLSIKKKPVIENTTEAHSGAGLSKMSREVSFDSDDMPCDLSVKSKSKEDKSKQKICNSDKLSRIVDSLKFRVNKMDDKVEEGSRKGSLDAALNLSDRNGDHSHSSSRRERDSGHESSSKDADKHTSPHGQKQSHSRSKESVPKIVQELLAAKKQKEEEDYLLSKHSKQKLLHEAFRSSTKSSSSQGDERSKQEDV